MVCCSNLVLAVVDCGNSFRRRDDPGSGQLRKNSITLSCLLHKSFIFFVICITNVVWWPKLYYSLLSTVFLDRIWRTVPSALYWKENGDFVLDYQKQEVERGVPGFFYPRNERYIDFCHCDGVCGDWWIDSASLHNILVDEHEQARDAQNNITVATANINWCVACRE